MATMASMSSSQITLYEEMSSLSTRMVEAARANDWNRLVSLEQAVAALRRTLMDSPDDNLSQGEVNLKATLIQRILDDDAEIRRHTEPWMEQVRQYLGSTVRQRRINDAYSASL
jgi:flagellar protein FliT